MILRTFITIVLALTLVVHTGVSAGTDTPKAVGVSALEFTLQDQFQQSWTWQKHWKGKSVVLIMSDWKGSDYTKNWTAPLVKKFSDKTQFVAFADVSLAPEFIRSYIRDKFKEVYPTSILLDWDGSVFQHYKVKAGVPNVLFIDAAGIVRMHTWGTGSEKHVAMVSKALEKFLAEQ